MATYRPGTIGGSAQEATAWINRVWKAELDVQANEEEVKGQLMMDLGAPHGQINVPKINRLATATLADSAAGTSLTYSANTETAASATPGTSYCAVEVNRNTAVRAVVDPEQALRKAIVEALTAKEDSDFFTLEQALSTNIVGDAGTNLTLGDILDAQTKLAQGAKSKYRPGVSTGEFIVGVTQLDDIMNIQQITNAQWRGDGENPIVKGFIKRALGFNFYESGGVSTASSTLWNSAFVREAYGRGYNEKRDMLAQEIELVVRLICWSDYAYLTRRDEYAVAVKSSIN